MGNDTLGGQIGGDPITVLTRKVEEIARKVREQASVRSLQSTSIDQGGIVVRNNGHVRVVAASGDVVDLGANTYQYSGGTVTDTAGITLDSAQDTDSAQVVLIDSLSSGSGLAKRAMLLKSPRASASGGMTAEARLDNNKATITGASNNGNLFGSVEAGTDPSLSQGYISAATETVSLFIQGAAITLTRAYANGASWSVPSGSSEWRALDGASGAYIPVRASSFPTSSSRGVKEDVTEVPFDALAAIDKAPVYRWKYKAAQAADGQHHISPMADDLPAELVSGTDTDRTVDNRDMVGVLWEALRHLAPRVKDLETKAARRVATVGQAATPASIAIGASQDVSVQLSQAMTDTEYDIAATVPAGFTYTVKSRSKTAVVITVKASVTIAGAGTVSVMVTAR